MHDTLDPIAVLAGADVSAAELAHASGDFSRPVAMRGLHADSTAVRDWTLTGLLAAAPERRVSIEHYATADPRAPAEIRWTTLAGFAEHLRAGEQRHWYLAANDLELIAPERSAELAPLAVVPLDREVVLRSVFFGIDTASAAHFHTRDHAVLQQVRGSKRIVFAPPDARAMLTTSPIGRRPQYSRRGPEPGGDAQAYFEDLLDGAAITVDLEPGDALFIPVHWWHWAEGPGENLSVTSFWKAPLRHWSFPTPGLRAALAVGLGPVLRTGTDLWSRLRTGAPRLRPGQ